MNIFPEMLNGHPAKYDYKTNYSAQFGGMDGYICDKSTVLREIKEFVDEKKCI